MIWIILAATAVAACTALAVILELGHYWLRRARLRGLHETFHPEVLDTRARRDVE